MAGEGRLTFCPDCGRLAARSGRWLGDGFMACRCGTTYNVTQDWPRHELVCHMARRGVPVERIGLRLGMTRVRIQQIIEKGSERHGG